MITKERRYLCSLAEDVAILADSMMQVQHVLPALT